MKKQLLFFLLGVFMSLGAFAQNLIVNGGFDLPDDGVKYQFINQIPGWLSDDPTINHNGRQNPVSGLDGSKYCEYMTNISGAIYQPIDAITGDSVLYKFSFKTSLDWLPNAGDLVYNVMYFYDWKKGTNISTRKLLDSIAIQMTTSGNGAPVQNVSGQFKLKLDSAVKYNGDSLVIGFRIHCAGNTNTWGKLDGITIKRDGTLYFPAITKPPKPTGLAVNTYRTLKNVILSWAAASATPQAYLVFKNNVRIDSIAGTRHHFKFGKWHVYFWPCSP
jgi:hypothetical protein